MMCEDGDEGLEKEIRGDGRRKVRVRLVRGKGGGEGYDMKE